MVVVRGGMMVDGWCVQTPAWEHSYITRASSQYLSGSTLLQPPGSTLMKDWQGVTGAGPPPPSPLSFSGDKCLCHLLMQSKPRVSWWSPRKKQNSLPEWPLGSSGKGSDLDQSCWEEEMMATVSRSDERYGDDRAELDNCQADNHLPTWREAGTHTWPYGGL